MSKTILQLKVTLMGTKPPIWRRVLIRNTTSLPDLHKIVQTTMGWTNSHLHQFINKGMFYAPPSEWDEGDTIDYTKIKISQFLKNKDNKIDYEYDFGDGWEHEIKLEKVLEKEAGKNYPECVAGKNACPPEDCGGVWGYMDLLKTISDPKHEDHEEMMDWLGGEFDPNEFDKDEINKSLGSDGFGVFSM